MASSPTRSTRSKSLEGTRSPTERTGNGERNSRCVQGGSADDGLVGVMSMGAVPLPQSGLEGPNLKCRSNSPPIWRKKKGLLELGDSYSYPRRSAQLSSRIASARPSEIIRTGMPSVSISDLDINLCNSRICATVDLAEPASVWAIGKQIGISCCEEEEEVVKEYGCMDDRDEEVAMGSKAGGRNVSK